MKVAARPDLGRDQAARLMGTTGIAAGSVPGPDGYAREHEAEGEAGGRGGAACARGRAPSSAVNADAERH